MDSNKSHRGKRGNPSSSESWETEENSLNQMAPSYKRRKRACNKDEGEASSSVPQPTVCSGKRKRMQSTPKGGLKGTPPKKSRKGDSFGNAALVPDELDTQGLTALSLAACSAGANKSRYNFISELGKFI